MHHPCFDLCPQQRTGAGHQVVLDDLCVLAVKMRGPLEVVTLWKFCELLRVDTEIQEDMVELLCFMVEVCQRVLDEP